MHSGPDSSRMLNFGNSNIVSSDDKNYKPSETEDIDHSMRAHYLISRGYFPNMTLEQVVEKLKKNDKR